MLDGHMTLKEYICYPGWAHNVFSLLVTVICYSLPLLASGGLVLESMGNNETSNDLVLYI
jgi:hypothetical protein